MMLPKEITVQETAAVLNAENPPRLIDVRQPHEYEIARLENGELLTQELANEMMAWSPETPVIFYCHHGARSMQAAAYFAQQGFTNVLSMRGGIAAWAREIDPSMPTY